MTHQTLDLANWPTHGKEATAILVYADRVSSNWQGALALVASGGEASPLVRVTSQDGMTSTVLAWDEFSAIDHDEDALAVSIDWRFAADLDDYVFAQFERRGTIRTEVFRFGALDQLRSRFLRSLMTRFEQLAHGGERIVLGVDPSGESTKDDWRNVYALTSLPPSTATVVCAHPSGTLMAPSHMNLVLRGAYDVFCVE